LIFRWKTHVENQIGTGKISWKYVRINFNKIMMLFITRHSKKRQFFVPRCQLDVKVSNHLPRWRNGQRARLECGRSLFEPWSGQTKDYKIGICCFSAKHAALRRKSKYWLARNQNNVYEWSDMSIRGLLFQWASTIKIQLSVLV